jgi:copper oxidase (laccase) domain-containing protein
LQDAGAKRLVAAIGPHISLAAFEVEEDVAQELLAASPDPDIVDRSGPKPHVDLRKMARAQLARAGLHHDDIDDVLGCTVLEPERFYSFRRDGEQSGRLLTAIVPR